MRMSREEEDSLICLLELTGEVGTLLAPPLLFPAFFLFFPLDESMGESGTLDLEVAEEEV